MGVLSDKTAIITGAGTGLGKAIARAMANDGAAVVLAGRRKDKIDAVAGGIVRNGGTAEAVVADVSQEAQVQALVKQAIELHGKIDILVNNAAVLETGGVIDTTLESWNYQLANNLTGAFLLTREVLPHMRSQRYGRIINITSGLAVNGAGGFAAYGVSKAGLEALTRTVAEEESHSQILASMFDPGTIKTEMHATGTDPDLVAPDIVQLAALARPGITGQLIHFGDTI
ncbi:SDR family NAD(P)-dependent oxidoreductase [Paenibacillus xerothermodurans]|uniref:SDR family NAD(P)-dependent oxidoreductase n=1 Tax=Paenibacillus xerothermodurans TaxID=1977292 RepID=A0A2W1NHZ7_PAEXE|nr:SDR family oxidoreductase [Paenibacillus xerothermodurans]PZE22771.1 SDR family NAD(P)-dependent oxidoreductase [Paenibacillus xerothermodurans]